MASRTKQKEAARARRLAEEQARAERARRQRRLQMLGGVVLIAAAIIAVAVAISSGGGGSAPKLNTAAARSAAATVNQELSGIPESGGALGNPNAKVTVTEFGDLKCPICKDFALGAEQQLIANDVKQGRVKLVYRSLCTATCSGPQPGVFGTQQAAAYAAGLQNREWYYIMLFYHLQGDELTSYVNANFLDGLAKLVPGLSYSKWLSDSQSPTLKAQVSADQTAAQAKNFSSTPTIVVQGPKGEQDFSTSLEGYSTYEGAIRAMS